jgi:hypothetical protein
MKIGASLEKLDKSGVYLSRRLAGSFDIGAPETASLAIPVRAPVIAV